MTLSKTKSLISGNSSSTSTNYQECADCGASNAQWASLNHGVVICDDCCLCHRSLGRCISIIKSMKKSYWPQSLIDTLYELVRKNSNQIWESALCNSSDGKLVNVLFKNMKKPSPKDSRANKMNYIKMKYENLSFLTRGKYSSIDELNQQLYSSVKTNNYEQTLRILSQGADANYRHQEEGNHCLHAAVLANQIGQVELLCLYGAEVTCLDRNSDIPYDLAVKLNYPQIADRLLELQFELTDEISFFLCSKKPDHKSCHFLIPDLLESIQNQEEMSRSTKENLRDLPDHLFEELTKDVYDELDRRQIELIWKCTVGPNLVNEAIPFLVIKSCFTQTRNQLRQKLARFNSNEFASLLVEILVETKNRYEQIDAAAGARCSKFFESEAKTKNNTNYLNDEEDQRDDEDENGEPLYDRVPSDEDYASVASEPSCPIPICTNLSESIGGASGASLLMSKPKSPLKNTHFTNNGNSNKNNINKTSTSPLKVNTTSSSRKSYNQTPPTSNSSTPHRSNPKNTPSTPSPVNGSSRFASKEHKILTTNFDKPPSHLNQVPQQPHAASSLVANAESALNSIINSLNHVDYSQLDGKKQQSKKSPLKNKKVNDLNINELRSENELMQSMIERLMEENAQLRAERMLLASNKNENLYATVKNRQQEAAEIEAGIEMNFNKSQFGGLMYPVNFQLKTDLADLNHCDVHNYENFAYAEKHLNELKMLELQELTDSKQKPHLNSNQVTKDLKNMPSSSSASAKLNYPDFNHHASSHFKVSPSESSIMPCNKIPLCAASSLPMHTTPGNNHEDNFVMPSKDSVIKKMKKITKAVQELFRATKESDFASLKELCERVSNCVNEMIILFPENLENYSGPLQENLVLLEDTCRNLVELIYKNYTQIELIINDTGDSNDKKHEHENGNHTKQVSQTLSGSSSISSALSSGSDAINQESMVLKTMIVSNLVSYSYEIAHTVKRIVCIMDNADN